MDDYDMKESLEIEVAKMKIRMAGIKCTSSAVEVFQVVSNSENPVSISQIKEKLKNKTNIATVYRILEKFEKASLVNRLQFNEQKSLYEIDKAPHDHFICENCNKVIDVYLNDKELQPAKELVAQGYNVRVNNASINFTGRCKDC